LAWLSSSSPPNQVSTRKGQAGRNVTIVVPSRGHPKRVCQSPNYSVGTQAILYATYNSKLESVMKKYGFNEFGNQAHLVPTKQADFENGA
jgi:hypothetical protein